MSCPVCGRKPVARFRPFCSKRCADIDLGRWLGGHYVLPDEATGPDPAPPPEPEEDPGP